MDYLTLQSLKKLIEYLYKDEQSDYEASDKPENHIFIDIMRLDAWTDEESKNH